MLTPKIDLVYSYEQKMKNAVLQKDMNRFEEISNEASANAYGTFPDAGITQNGLNTYFSEDLFDLLVNGNFDVSGLKEIDKDFIKNNKKYVEYQLDIDLSNVDVFFLDDSFRTAEGWAMPCKVDEHYVVLPIDLENNFLSEDLIIHELGHTAEFCIRRKNMNENRITTHKILSETIAHYSQFKYLSTKSLDKRISVLGSILQVAPLLEIVRYCLENKTQEWESEVVVQSTNFETLRKFYSIEKLLYLVEPYKEKSISEIYYLAVEPRLGAILALSLLDNKDAIKALCLAETNKSVKTILDELGLDSDELLDFSKADKILKKFIFQN